VSWELYFTKQAQKDAKKVASSNLRPQVEKLLDMLRVNLFQNPPSFEKLVGDLDGAYSRRINIHNRLVYQVLKDARAVRIIRMWTHYE
jgi:Txe/YoeB family toxin of toxin-antitoxin system